MIKKYILFSYDEYYPGGGWHDYVRGFDSLEEAKEWIKDPNNSLSRYKDLVDLETGEIVLELEK